MRKFIYTIIAFSSIVVSLYYLLSFSVKSDYIGNDYMSAIVFKHNRVKNLNRPKIIFAGGSNLALGLNSELIEKELNAPVVNLSLHAGLGLDFMLNELKAVIIKNDVVFLSTEYFLDLTGELELKRLTSNYYSDARKYYIDDELNSFAYWLNYSKQSVSRSLDLTRINLEALDLSQNPIQKEKSDEDVYSRNGFNKYGDVISHLNKVPSPKKLNGRMLFKYFYWDGINQLNEFHKYAKEKGVTVFFVYPNYCESQFNQNKNVINKLALDMSKDLKMEILNSPSDFVYPDSLFFDTVYHLNKEGREKRTKRMIELIKQNVISQRVINNITFCN